jgi:NAD(P)-dependent dehydrogenase (short-subunit alcohol dehydrogenase family)
MDLQLEGKRAIITGGSRGLGKAMAHQLAREGCDVVIGARTESMLNTAAEELAKETGRKIVPIVLDVNSLDSITTFVKGAADALGGIEIVINNAAQPGGTQGDIEEIDEDGLLWDFTQKAVGYLRVAREALPYMKQAGWGRIINISGLQARNPGTGVSAAARNGALIAMNKAWANALGKYNITVNAIYPGSRTVTERTEAQARVENKTLEEKIRELDERAVQKHHTTADDIANFATFLASPLAIGMTGEAIAVAAGQTVDVHY